MATMMQRRAVKNIVEKRMNFSKGMREAGYSKVTAAKPQNLTLSAGFKELCEEMGLTDELLTKALVDDIKKKPQNRKAELELGFRLKGRLTEEHEGNKTLVVVVSPESSGRYAALPSTGDNR
jgi:hypothetical protein